MTQSEFFFSLVGPLRRNFAFCLDSASGTLLDGFVSKNDLVRVFFQPSRSSEAKLCVFIEFGNIAYDCAYDLNYSGIAVWIDGIFRLLVCLWGMTGGGV